MTPDIKEAVEEIRRAFPGRTIDVEPEARGGAYVVVHDVPLGDQYKPVSSWVGFFITFQYPHADVYPHFIDAGVVRTDGKTHGEGFALADWRGRRALQISRRSNHLNPAVDTAASKLAKVLQWIKSK
jgi:hypothetical protein